VWVKISGRAAVSSISSTAAAFLICHNTAAVMDPVMVVLSHLKCERIYHGPKIKNLGKFGENGQSGGSGEIWPLKKKRIL